MASTTIRMVTTKGYEKLQLSYPYDRFERNNRSWDDKKYRARGHPRYHLSDIAKHCKGQDLKMNVIEEKLMSNILGEGVVYGVCKEKASWPFCKEKENEDVFFGVKTGKVDASGSSREEENLMVHASTVL
ncbi:hypothetical protein Tco_1304467 [Tanacetum coccineum]